MSNVLDNAKQQQILALGRLGWSLRRIEQALAVRRETISGYLPLHRRVTSDSTLEGGEHMVCRQKVELVIQGGRAEARGG
jgi:hypothetical protein